jgi:S1-C subfamily serine protease
LGRFPQSPQEEQARQQTPQLDPTHAAFLPEAWGNGVVVGARGLVLVPFHLVASARKVWVLFPEGKGSYAEIRAADAASDWGVVELLDPPPDLVAMKVGNLPDFPQGTTLWTIAWPEGQPESLGPCIHAATVNRRARPLPRDVRGQPARQTRWAIASLLELPGSVAYGLSGAMVVNTQGELLGLTTMVTLPPGTNHGLGYALPLDAAAQRILARLQAGQEIEYGFLGVDTEDVSRSEMRSLGVTDGGAVRISREVVPGVPAAQAGLRLGDILLAVQGERVRDGGDLLRAIGLSFAGNRVDLAILREGRSLHVRVAELAKLGQPGPQYARQRTPLLRGLQVDYVSVLLPEIPPENVAARERLALALREGSVVVREVQPGSPAERAGVRVGDFITHLQGQPVSSPKQFHHLAPGIKGGMELTLLPQVERAPGRKLVVEEK